MVRRGCGCSEKSSNFSTQPPKSPTNTQHGTGPLRPGDNSQNSNTTGTMNEKVTHCTAIRVLENILENKPHLSELLTKNTRQKTTPKRARSLAATNACEGHRAHAQSGGPLRKHSQRNHRNPAENSLETLAVPIAPLASTATSTSHPSDPQPPRRPTRQLTQNCAVARALCVPDPQDTPPPRRPARCISEAGRVPADGTGAAGVLAGGVPGARRAGSGGVFSHAS
jgi:hypothetical protein